MNADNSHWHLEAPDVALGGRKLFICLMCSIFMDKNNIAVKNHYFKMVNGNDRQPSKIFMFCIKKLQRKDFV